MTLSFSKNLFRLMKANGDTPATLVKRLRHTCAGGPEAIIMGHKVSESWLSELAVDHLRTYAGKDYGPKPKIPSMRLVVSIADVYGVTPGSLLDPPRPEFRYVGFWLWRRIK